MFNTVFVSAELGDYDAEVHSPSLISEFRFVPNQNEEFEIDVLEAFKKNRSVTLVILVTKALISRQLQLVLFFDRFLGRIRVFLFSFINSHLRDGQNLSQTLTSRFKSIFACSEDRRQQRPSCPTSTRPRTSRCTVSTCTRSSARMGPNTGWFNQFTSK